MASLNIQTSYKHVPGETLVKFPLENFAEALSKGVIEQKDPDADRTTVSVMTTAWNASAPKRKFRSEKLLVY